MWPPGDRPTDARPRTVFTQLSSRMLRWQYRFMDNSSGVGVLDKAALVLAALEAGPPRWRAWSAPPVWPDPPLTGSPSPSSTTGWSSRPARPVRPRPSARRARHRRGEDRLLAAAGPVLARLRDATGESAQLFRRQGDHRICVAAAERPTGLRDTIPVGATLTMLAGSAAQILLAWEEPERLHRGLQGARFTATMLAASAAGAGRRAWRARAWRGLGLRAGTQPRVAVSSPQCRCPARSSGSPASRAVCTLPPCSERPND